MAFEELKEDLMGAEADVRSYVENSDEYLRLKIFKIIMHGVTGSVQFLLIGAGVIFALLFLSFATCLALSQVLDSFFLGFLIVAGFYMLLVALLYIFREKLNTPILKKFSKHYFE